MFSNLKDQKQKSKIYEFANLANPAISNRRFTVVQYAAFAALLFGIKLWVIGTYGNATPFWDQWDSEADSLYKPFLNDTLTWSSMFSPHNEHRIFTTRTLALLILYVNKIWNPLLQMVVNAGLHVCLLAFANFLFVRVVGRNYLPGLLAFSLILFGVPYAWENTISAFQSQFYFVLLFSIASLWFTVTSDPFSRKWWLGIFFAALAFVSLASGIFALAAAAIINTVFFFGNLRRTKKQLLAIVLLCTLFVLGSWLTPSLPYHASLKANSFSQFYYALTAILSWPISQSFFSAIIRNAPALMLLAIMIWRRPPIQDHRWFLVALVIWSLGQSASIAYGRAGVIMASRYMDLFAIVILVNFACLIALVKTYTIQRRYLYSLAVFVWLAVILVSLGWYGGKQLPVELAAKSNSSRTQETNTRNYVETGDFSHLKDKPHLEIPYPNAERLAHILSAPEIREILPTNISKPVKRGNVNGNASKTFVIDGYYFTTPKIADTTWGSYNTQGDGALGKVEIKFLTKIEGGVVNIPVAGYPLNSGIKMEIVQNGHHSPISIDANPKESWGTAHAKISNSGEFSVVLTDSSTTTWLAVGTPTVISKLDQYTNRLLSHYYLFVILGFVLLIFLLTQNSMISEAVEIGNKI